MAESSQQEQVPQEEQPESPIPFEPTTQVGFDIEEIIFNPNNEVALLYPPHINSDYFKVVSDFISTCFLRKAFTRSPNQYKDYLSEFWYTAKSLKNSKVWYSTPTRGILGEVGVNTFRNAIRANYLAYSSEYVAPPPIETAQKTIQPEGPPFTDHMLAIYNANEPVAFEVPKTSSKDEKKSKIDAAKSVSSSKGDTGSQTSNSVKETQSSLALDTNRTQPSASTPMVAEPHKEALQAIGGPTYLGVSSEDRANPQFNRVVLASVTFLIFMS
ncbi:hypothetical protein Tco_1474759, partial [Tanacetum coccineum]